MSRNLTSKLHVGLITTWAARKNRRDCLACVCTFLGGVRVRPTIHRYDDGAGAKYYNAEDKNRQGECDADGPYQTNLRARFTPGDRRKFLQFSLYTCTLGVDIGQLQNGFVGPGSRRRRQKRAGRTAAVGSGDGGITGGGGRGLCIESIEHTHMMGDLYLQNLLVKAKGLLPALYEGDLWASLCL